MNWAAQAAQLKSCACVFGQLRHVETWRTLVSALITLIFCNLVQQRKVLAHTFKAVLFIELFSCRNCAAQEAQKRQA